MDDSDDSGACVNIDPPIPETGLTAVLAAWSGRGQIWDALALPETEHSERTWSARDLRRRADRILLERLVPLLERWPIRTTSWTDLLPAARTHASATRSSPFSGVSWSRTFAASGWPPKSFIGREAVRHADTLPVSTLLWTVQTLIDVRSNAVRVYPEVDTGIRRQLDAAAALLEREPLRSATPHAPGKPELLALRSEGSPWGAVADVADEFRVLAQSVPELARRLLLPDSEIHWRLFHLAVLGVMLSALRDLGCTVTSLRSLGAQTNGPAYQVAHPAGTKWDLWFEAGGMWSHAGIMSPYSNVTRTLLGPGRPLGADLVLIQPKCQALIVECKYSADPERISRNGYYQATTYAAEIRSHFAPSVTAAVVGPEGVVTGPTFTRTVAGQIGIMPPSEIHNLLASFFAEAQASA